MSNGFATPRIISNELCDFLQVPHGSKVPRTDITRKVIMYIKANKLEDTSDRKIIHPDATLEKLFGDHETRKQVLLESKRCKLMNPKIRYHNPLIKPFFLEHFPLENGTPCAENEITHFCLYTEDDLDDIETGVISQSKDCTCAQASYNLKFSLSDHLCNILNEEKGTKMLEKDLMKRLENIPDRTSVLYLLTGLSEEGRVKKIEEQFDSTCTYFNIQVLLNRHFQ
jgi:hypothetical protein